MEQEHERQRTRPQPTDSQQSTLPFVSVAYTFHFVPLNVSFFPEIISAVCSSTPRMFE